MNRSRRADLLARYEKWTKVPLLALVLALVPLLLIAYVVDVSDSVDSTAEYVSLAILAVFAVDLVVRTYLSERRLHYLVTHWYDVLMLVPFLRPLRLVRTARGLRLLRLGRVFPVVARIAVEARDLGKRRGLQWILLVGVAAVFVCAYLVFELERSEDGAIDDYGTALWWAMSTITTVGYGDATPVTPEGRGIAILLMVIGISFFSWVTANIAAFLIESPSDGEAVTTADLMRKLESLETELKELRSQLAG